MLLISGQAPILMRGRVCHYFGPGCDSDVRQGVSLSLGQAPMLR